MVRSHESKLLWVQPALLVATALCSFHFTSAATTPSCTCVSAAATQGPACMRNVSGAHQILLRLLLLLLQARRAEDIVDHGCSEIVQFAETSIQASTKLAEAGVHIHTHVCARIDTCITARRQDILHLSERRTPASMALRLGVVIFAESTSVWFQLRRAPTKPSPLRRGAFMSCCVLPPKFLMHFLGCVFWHTATV